MLHSATALLEAGAAMESIATWMVMVIVRILGEKVTFFVVHVKVPLGVPEDRSN